MPAIDNPKSVECSFSRWAPFYSEAAAVQQQIAKDLISFIPNLNQTPETVLDVGSGTGFLTAALCGLYPEAQIHALDISSGMCEALSKRAKAERLSIEVFCADVFSYEPLFQYSLLVSSSALHWMLPYEALFKRLKRWKLTSAPLALAVMTEGTLHELHECRRTLFPEKMPHRALPKQAEIEAALKAADFTLSQSGHRIYRSRHSCARAFFGDLQKTGVTSGGFSQAQSRLSRGELERLCSEYSNRFVEPDGGVFASYAVFFGIAI